MPIILAVAPSITTRPATADDADQIVEHVQAGFDSYVEFAQPGWTPPRAADERDRTAQMLGDPDTWALLALADGEPVGHVSFFAARAGDRRAPLASRPPIPGLAHFWQLFVMPEWWGRGVGSVLHEHAIAAIGDRGFERARLFTPSEHVRARRFYERRGWSLVEEEWHEGLELRLCEYGLVLA